MVSVDLSPSSYQSSPNNSDTSQTIILDVKGMKCAGCVSAVERQLKQESGVISAQVNLITSVASVKYNETKVKPENLARKLTGVGFPTVIRAENQEDNINWQKRQQQKRQQQQQEEKFYLISSAILLLFSLLGHLHHWGFSPLPIISNIWFHWLLATLALLIPGRDIILNGWQGLWHGQANMNSLVGIGTVVAYLTSCIALVFPELGWECFFDEPVMLLGFIFLGRVLESRAKNRAADSLTALINFRPQLARLVPKIEVEKEVGLEIPASQVKAEEWVRVLEGEKFPVDGKIVRGETTVDESMLTGESVPVQKNQGQLVTAGTVNLSSAVIVETINSGAKTKLSQIIATVESAQNQKAPIQKLADTVSGYFAYGIMTIALLTFTFWYGWGTKIWSEIVFDLDTTPIILSLKLAIDVLVIACPCALGLATPTAILVGTSLGAENGLLIRGGDILEQVKDLDTIVFDKTGTLTYGKPQITDIISFCFTQDQLIAITASLEKNANHPLALAILSEAQKLELPLLETELVNNVQGKGIQGIVKTEENVKKTFYVGNQKWLAENGIKITAKTITQVEELENQGKTVIYIAQKCELVGLIALNDQIRPDALPTVTKLKEMGYQVVMISGDQPQVVHKIAQQLDIENYYGGIEPQGKVELVQQLQQDSSVGIVGDGINDSPAMAVAQLAIAMPQGSQLTLETANIILTRGNLMDVVRSIKLSKLTLNKIKQNLFWALGYNIVAIPIASGCLLPQHHILLNPASAAGLMAFSSLVVVTNSLLLRYKFSTKVCS